MNKLHDIKGRFTSRKAKVRLWITGILLTAGILTLAVIGGQEVYLAASQRVKDLFTPKVQTVIAETPEPTDMRDWVLWKVEQAGIDKYEAYSIINCESKWNTESINHATANGGNGTDLGLWQINTKYQPQVKPSCSLDYKCSTEEAIKIYKKNKGWGAWSCASIVGLK